MRIAWLTDIHLDFVSDAEVERLLADVRAAAPDLVLLGGDIAEAGSVVGFLERLDEGLGLPVHFVLGNHDFYGGSVTTVRDRVERLCARRPKLTYLTRAPWQPLGPGLALLGHDGWGDGRAGDFLGSSVRLNDYVHIEELSGLDTPTRAARLAALGDEAAEHVSRELQHALEQHPAALLLTHVPPTVGSCWHEGQTADDNWAPHFVCQAVGEAIVDVMRRRADRTLTVLCGHTHGAGESRPLDNVRILTGAAEYGNPAIARILELTEGAELAGS